MFIGFDFNQWHLRLLMHLINRYQKQKETYALQNPQNLSELTNFFYKRNFDVQFVDIPPLEFAKKFEEQLTVFSGQPKNIPELKVYLMYAPKDEKLKTQLDIQLSPLKRSELIQTWDEEQLLPGVETDLQLAQQLNSADLIILLVTANFFASDQVYEKQLDIALQRHEIGEVVVIPILMESCLWDVSVLRNLTTILPRNKKPLNEQPNETAALADTIKQLEGWCKKIHRRKVKKANRRI